MMGTEQPAQILLPANEIGGSVSILNPFRTDTEICTDPIIQTTIVQFNQATLPGHNYRNHFPILSLNSGINVPISGRNIDNPTEMKLQGPIVTTIP